jgi:hypothetical protein
MDFRSNFMKANKKKSLIAHSCTALSIGVMAWVAGTVVITLFQWMEETSASKKKAATADA